VPRKLPVVLSPEEVARFLDAAPGLKYKVALSVAYGAGLRVSEVVALKVSDIDSKRMVIRIEQGKGHKDRYVMLSPHLLELLRAWYKWPPQGGCSGMNPVNPMTARQLRRPAMPRPTWPRSTSTCPRTRFVTAFATHLLEQNTDIRVIQVLLDMQARHHRALYASRPKTIREIVKPARSHYGQAQGGRRTARLTRGLSSASTAGGRGHLSRPRPGMAPDQCGHVSLGQLKVMSRSRAAARRRSAACRAL